ncbi:MAG: hypothetical protein L3J69_13530 [Desulfobacula sp.]|nr:hypothetical protein [Desulfobacula sp.]
MNTKNTIVTMSTGTALFFIVAGMLFFNPLTVMACGYGNSGGSDFVPQRQNAYAGNQAAVAIDIEQARSIVENHVSRLNPDLAIGNINDAGGFFEVEIINGDNEVLQMLGVDKYSGRLMMLN